MHSSELGLKQLGASVATSDESMQSRVKPLAVGCKVIATLEALGMAWFLIGSWYLDMRSATPPRDAPLDWGTPAYYQRTYLRITVVAVMALLVVIPNRWLVSSRILFSITLLMALSPAGLFIIFFSPGHDFMVAYFLCFMLLLTGLWPLSLCLSFWRNKKGETFLYA